MLTCLFRKQGPGLFERRSWFRNDCRLMMPETASKAERSRNEQSEDKHDTHDFGFPLLVLMIRGNALVSRIGVAVRAHPLAKSGQLLAGQMRCAPCGSKIMGLRAETRSSLPYKAWPRAARRGRLLYLSFLTLLPVVLPCINYSSAVGAYEEALKRRPGKLITLRQQARVIKKSR
jgi:hypothetical protein